MKTKTEKNKIRTISYRDGTVIFQGIFKKGVVWRQGDVITTQDILTDKELVSSKPKHSDIIGPDTLLYWWQDARSRKDYKEADRIREIGRSKSMNPAFTGTRYEVHHWVTT